MGGDAAALLLHNRTVSLAIAQTHTAMLIHDLNFGLQPKVMGEAQPVEIRDLAQPVEIPDWAQMFGSLELCDCQHCRSVYGPAAYLVDLLQFLDVPAKSPKATPLDHLIGNKEKQVPGRRPDLAHIKLTCENTENAMPCRPGERDP